MRELLATTDSHELSQWEQYERLDPFGQWRADWRAGIIAAAAANPYRESGRDPFTPQDFMPDFEAEAEDPTPLAEKITLTLETMARDFRRRRIAQAAGKN